MSVLRLMRSAFRFVRPRQNAEFTQTKTDLQLGSLEIVKFHRWAKQLNLTEPLLHVFVTFD